MLIVADNIQITNRLIQEALDKMDAGPISALAKKCEDAGADAIDINPGPLTRQGEDKMAFLVETIQDAVGVPLLLDTSNPSAMKAGLMACRDKATVNGFSLEPVKVERILPLAKEYDCKIIGFLLHPDGRVPRDAEERLDLAARLFALFEKTGIEPERLIIDPIIVPLMWEDGARQAKEVLDAIRMLPDLLGFPVKTLAGLSNLTTGRGSKQKKRLVEEAFLSMLAAAGLDMALVDITHSNTVKFSKACDMILGSKIFSWEEVS